MKIVQVQATHSISAALNYPGVGAESEIPLNLKELGR
jgi:tryptophan synthase beta subunit